MGFRFRRAARLGRCGSILVRAASVRFRLGEGGLLQHPVGSLRWAPQHRWAARHGPELERIPKGPTDPRPLAHRAAWRETPEPPDAVVSAGVCGAYLSCSASGEITTPIVKPSWLVISMLHFPVKDPGTGICQQLSAVCSAYQHLPANPLLSSGIQWSFCIP